MHHKGRYICRCLRNAPQDGDCSWYNVHIQMHDPTHVHAFALHINPIHGAKVVALPANKAMFHAAYRFHAVGSKQGKQAPLPSPMQGRTHRTNKHRTCRIKISLFCWCVCSVGIWCCSAFVCPPSVMLRGVVVVCLPLVGLLWVSFLPCRCYVRRTNILALWPFLMACDLQFGLLSCSPKGHCVVRYHPLMVIYTSQPYTHRYAILHQAHDYPARWPTLHLKPLSRPAGHCPVVQSAPCSMRISISW